MKEELKIDEIKLTDYDLYNIARKIGQTREEAIAEYKQLLAKERKSKIRISNVKKLIHEGNYEINSSIEEVYYRYFSSDKLRKDIFKVDLQPPFQRSLVWTDEQKTKWLEFIFSGGRTSRTIYFNCPNWDSYEGETEFEKTIQCIDGQQRLSAIKDFMEEKIEVFGFKKSDWLDAGNVMVKININSLKTKKEVLSWYIQLNSAGTPHTAEEIKKATKLLNDEENGVF